MLLYVIRTFYLLAMMAFSVSYAFRPEVVGTEHGMLAASLYIIVPILLGIGLLAVDILWQPKRLQAMSGLFFGILGGLAIAYVVGVTVDLANKAFFEPTSYTGAPAAPAPERVVARPTSGPAFTTEVTHPDDSSRAAFIGLIKALLGSSAVYMCVSFVLQTKDDFRFVIPYVEFSRQTRGARPILLDTSVIIDGRIADIAETNILESEVVVPRFVLGELQTIADSDDKLKRNRGRRGLDILNRLRTKDKMSIQILDAHVPTVDDAADVDAKLVALAKHLDARIVTNDYNLNKIAQLRGVEVININDLANALKPVVLPGETMTVKVVKPGEEIGQGVGYLEDGTMVVAEGARDQVGKDITISVTSVLQTSAGRMIFGRMDADRYMPRRRT